MSQETDTKPNNGVKGQGRRLRRRRPVQTYSTYIYKVLRQVHPNTGISRRAMSIMNSFVNDIFERIASESGRLVRHNKKATLSSREVQSAIRLLLPGMFLFEKNHILSFEMCVI